ncbi:hypothetical protein [Sinimarinibacterium flocculans]|uniref:hypothetical protein n=1 Tax=Sinimarinibacterium flocculans TaxID=985250 RepID=UPI00248F5FF7|nr:hypothetical protein [Sinimarinibacterium flocculans]
MNKTVLAIAAGLMACATSVQAQGLLPRLQPTVAKITGLAAAPALAGLPGQVQPKEGEPRFGLPALPQLNVPELPYVPIPGIPSDQLYWLGHWLDYTVNDYSRFATIWATDFAVPAAWDELDIVLGMAGAGDIGGAGNRMAGYVKKIPAPPQPVIPSELGLGAAYNNTWNATIGAVFGEPYAP